VQFVKEQLTFTGEDTAMATLLLSVMGAFAEFERSLIRERQREGIALARQRGAYRGRTRALDAEQVAQLRKRVADGIPKATLAREFGVSRETVDGKSNEITAFAPLLDGLDITGAIVTADALHTQRGHAEYLTGRGAHYLFTVKGNQPTLYAQLKALPWRDIPAVDVTKRQRPRPAGVAHREGHRSVRRDRISARPTRDPDHSPPEATDRPEVEDRDRLRDHRPRPDPDPPGRDRRHHPRTLAHREQAALGPRRDHGRGRVPDPHRPRTSGHGDPPQPRHQRPPPSRRHQHRRRDPPSRPTSQPRHPTAATSRDQHNSDHDQIGALRRSLNSGSHRGSWCRESGRARRDRSGPRAPRSVWAGNARAG